MISFKSTKTKSFFYAFLVLLCLSLFTLWRYTHNFHEVIPHIVYRSNQLSSQELKTIVAQNRIRSIINLRGQNPNEEWYQQELKLSQELGIIHRDLSLQSKVLPTRVTLTQLAVQIEALPKPLLIHCESGVDRSGFAANIALLVLSHPNLSDLKTQISWRYFVFSNQSVGKQFLRSYTLYLNQTHSPVGQSSFIGWLQQF
jgi:protein tyrosine/serine phosphatase